MLFILFVGEALSQTVFVKSPMANVRRGPGEEFEIIIKVERGQEFKVIDETREWIKVELPKGALGWISKGLVEYKKTETAITEERGTINVDMEPFVYYDWNDIEEQRYWSRKPGYAGTYCADRRHGEVIKVYMFLYSPEFRRVAISLAETTEALANLFNEKSEKTDWISIVPLPEPYESLKSSGTAYFPFQWKGDFTGGAILTTGKVVPPGSYTVDYALEFSGRLVKHIFPSQPEGEFAWGPVQTTVRADDITYIHLRPTGYTCQGDFLFNQGRKWFVEKYILGWE